MSAPQIALIAAVSSNGVIGRDNTLPWRLSDDLKRFKALTTGHAVIMGRKTWDSLGRPLPNRRNVVITRQQALRAEGAELAHSFDEAMALCAKEDIVFVIGGAQLYAQTLDRANLLFITEVHANIEGDAHFCPFDKAQFREVSRVRMPAGEKNDHAFDFVDYRRTELTPGLT